jgi:hypothetical protein
VKTDPEFQLLTARQMNPTIFGVTFSPPESVTNLDWDVVLVTISGEKTIHQSQNDGGGRRSMLYHYQASADQIKQIIYDSRPWQVMQLRDVSLYPGQTSHPSAVNATGWRTSGGGGG